MSAPEIGGDPCGDLLPGDEGLPLAIGAADPQPMTVASRYLRMGDRILVEPADGESFEATVVICLGWGLVHGVMNWQMRRDDGETFIYGIHIDAPVQVAAA